jgi:PAS domain S-box-containing protein
MAAHQHTILIVGDDSRERDALFELLQQNEYRVLKAATCEQALDCARKQKPTVALIDLWLADLPGHVVLHGIRQAAPDTECIALLTSPAQQDGAYEALKLGAFTFLRRAYDARQLLTTIQRAIERHELRGSIDEIKSRLAVLFDALPAGVLIVDEHTGMVVDANPAAVNQIGAKREEIVGSMVQARPMEGAGGGGARSAGTPAGSTQTGKRIPATRTVAALSINGRRHRLECFLDVTGRLEVEDQLAAAVAVNALLGEDLQDLVLTVDRDGRVQHVYQRPAATDGAVVEPLAESAALVPATARERYRQVLHDLFRDGRSGAFSGGAAPFEAWSIRAEPVRARGEIVGAAVRVRNLAERERASQRLQARRVALDATREAVLMLTAEGTIMDANAAACRLLDSLAAELIGSPFCDLDHPDPVQPWSRLWTRVVMHERVDYESRLRVREGGMVPVQVTLRHVLVDGAAMALAIIEDRLREEAAAHAVREVAAHERSLLEALLDPVWLLDRSGHVRNLNEAAVRLSGQPAAELVGASYDQAIAPALARARQQRMDEVYIRGKAVEFEDQTAQAYYDVHISPIRDEDGAVNLAAVLARDVTRMRSRQAQWVAMWEHSPLGVIMLQAESTPAASPADDADRGAIEALTVQEANASALAFFGADKLEALQRSFAGCFSPEAARACAAALAALRSGGGGIEDFENGFQAGDGAERVGAVRLVALPSGADKRWMRIQMMVVDRTQQKLALGQILETSAQERRRVGQEVERTLVGPLSALAASLEAGGSAGAVDAPAVLQAVKTILEHAQAATVSLARTQAGEVGLMAALGRLADDGRRLWGIECRCQVRSAALIQDGDLSRHLLAIAGESLDYVARCRRAKSVSIQLSSSPGEGTLTLRADAQGPESAGADEDDMAIRLIRVHAEMIRATFTMATHPRDGLTLQCRFPLG